MAGKESPTKSRGRLRKPLAILGILILVALLFVALLPTFVSWGLGRGLVVGAIEDNINGSVAVDGLSVGWFSDQRIDGLRISGADGDTTTDLTLRLEKGLLSLLFGGFDQFGTLTLSGDVAGVRYEDGTTSFAQLLKTTPEKERQPKKREPGDGPPGVSGTIVFDDIEVALTDRRADERFVLRDLDGTVQLDLADVTQIDLSATTLAADTEGSLDVEGTIRSILTGRGGMNWDGAEIDLDATVQSFPAALLDGLLGMSDRLASITGPMVETAELHVEGTLQNAEATVDARTTHASASGGATIVDNRLRVSSDSPLVARAALRQETVDAWLPRATVESMGLASTPTLVNAAGDDQPSVEVRVVRADLPLPSGDGWKPGGGSFELAASGGGARFAIEGLDAVETLELPSFSAGLTSDDLRQSLTLDADASAIVNDVEPSRLSAHVVAQSPLAEDGTLALADADLNGEVRGESIVTALFQPMVGDMGVVLTRDVGPRLDVTAQFAAAETRTISANATAQNLSIEAAATIGEGMAIDGRRLRIETDLHPDLLAAFAPDRAIRTARRATIEMSRFSSPVLAGDDGGFALARLGGAGRLTLSGDAVSTSEDDEPTIDVERADFEFESPALAERVRVTGGATVNASRVEVEETITGLFTSDGRLSPMDATPVGRLAIRDIRPATIARFAPAARDTARHALGGPLTAEVVTQDAQSGLEAVITLSSPGVNGSVTAMRRADTLTIEAGELATRLTPVLSRALQPERASPILLTADAATLTLEPSTIAQRTEAGYSFDAMELTGRLTASRTLVEQAPLVAEPVTLADLASRVVATPGRDGRYRVDGTAMLRDPDDDAHLADATFEATLSRSRDDGSFSPAATVRLAKIDVARLETTVAAATTLAQWLGASGDLAIDASPIEGGWRVAATSGFPNLSGTFTLALDETTITVDAEQPTVILNDEALETLLNPVAEAAAGEAPRARIDVARDVPLALTVNRLVVPRAILAGGAIESGATTVDVSLDATGPLTLNRSVADAPVTTAEFRRVAIAARSDDLAQGLTVTTTGVLRTEGGEDEAGRSRFEIRSELRDLLDEQSTLAIAGAAIDVDASVTEVPTWVIDAFAGRRSLFEDALGDTVSAEIVSRNFSTQSGRLNATATSGNGSNFAAHLAGRNGLIRTRQAEPTRGELALTEELRERLLYKIHPIFADVRSMDGKLEFVIRDARVPVENDLSKLNAEIVLKGGDITLDAGSQLLRVFEWTEATRRETIPGRLSDLVVQIRNGVVTYDDFVVQVGEGRGEREYRHRLTFSGSIDLVEEHVNAVVGLYPVKDARTTFEELRVLPDSAQFGLKFSGDMYDRQGNPKQLDVEPILDIRPEDILRGGLERIFDEIGDEG